MKADSRRYNGFSPRIRFKDSRGILPRPHAYMVGVGVGVFRGLSDIKRFIGVDDWLLRIPDPTTYIQNRMEST